MRVKFSGLTSALLLVALPGLVSCASAGKRRVSRSDPSTSDYSFRDRTTKDTGNLSSTELSSMRSETASWIWPVESPELTSRYGHRGGDYHDGVDLRASRKTPVFSVASGTVLYASNRISGYGNMIVLRHEDQLSTVYAHNDKMFVKKGERVKRGQKIALSGNTGRSSGPHVHFEVRRGTMAIDPLAVMPNIGSRPQDEQPAQVAASSGQKPSRRIASQRNSSRSPGSSGSSGSTSGRRRRITRMDSASNSQSSAERPTRRRITRVSESRRTERARIHR